jgi:hypothetical protein
LLIACWIEISVLLLWRKKSIFSLVYRAFLVEQRNKISTDGKENLFFGALYFA